MHRKAIKYMVRSQIDAVNKFLNHAKEMDEDDKRYILQELHNVENLCFDYLNIRSDISDKIYNMPIGKIDIDTASEIRADIANLKKLLHEEM